MRYIKAVDIFFWMKERIMYILWCYPSSCFSVPVIYKIYREMFPDEKPCIHTIYTAVKQLIDDGIIKIENTTADDLKKNGYRVTKRKKRMPAKKEKKYVLTDKGEEYFLFVIKRFPKSILNNKKE